IARMPVAAPSGKHDLLPAPARRIAPYFLLALAVFAFYGNVYDNSFLFDDDLLITINQNLLSWSHIGGILTGSTTSGAHIAGGFYRPLQMLLYLVVYQFWGKSTFAFHLLNLVLHAANACLVYRLGTKLDFKRGGVFLAALVWALHPLHTEAVTYMSATADPLFSFFCLSAVLVLLPDPMSGHGTSISSRKIFAVIPLFLLALVSKETAVMLPLLVMACLFYISPRRLDPRTYVRTWPLWVVTIVYSYWRAHAAWLDGPHTYERIYALPQFATMNLYAHHFIYRLYTFFATLPAYAALLAWPTGLHMERSFAVYTSLWRVSVLTGMGMFLFAAAHIVRSAVASGKMKPNAGLPMAWGLLWFFTAHAPDSGLAVAVNSLLLEHWMYLPSAGLFLGIGETLAGMTPDRPRIAMACGAAAFLFAMIMGCKTYAQNEIWHDPVVFYNNIFAHGEQSARAHNNLALYYDDRGDIPDAITQFKKAIAISDTYAETRYNLALAYLSLPDARAHVQEARDNLTRALAIDPNFYRAWGAMAGVYTLEGNRKKAAQCAARANALIKEQE
ncbi:MAG: tetratricopeptide repeat protein, partial [Alphaproteobacteria bacterium]|nr:tetratricopeptide repeat protein [Alphaproteobacteria bacterium]